MTGTVRQLGITFAGYVAGVVAAFLALIAIVDMQSLNLASGLPKVAIMTPMLAVIVYWGVVRLLGVSLRAGSTFLFGGIAVYFLLYACGRLIATGSINHNTAFLFGAVVLFLMAYANVRKVRVTV